MQHLLRCPLLENECSLEDLATANEKALHCVTAWPNIWLNSEMMDTKERRSHRIHVATPHYGPFGRPFFATHLPEHIHVIHKKYSFATFFAIVENHRRTRRTMAIWKNSHFRAKNHVIFRQTTWFSGKQWRKYLGNWPQQLSPPKWNRSPTPMYEIVKANAFLSYCWILK